MIFRMRKSDLKRLSIFFLIVLFWGLNVPGYLIPALRFISWKLPVLWMAGIIIFKICEQSGNSFIENTGKTAYVKLYYALYLGVFGITIFPIMEFTFFRSPPIIALNIIGFLLMCFGGFLRFIALATLGKYFSTHIEIYRDHQLVDKGIYSMIRHPGYLGSICFGIGSILSVNAMYSIVFFALYFIPVLLCRIYFEERVLNKNLTGYKEYVKRTKLFIPYLF